MFLKASSLNYGAIRSGDRGEEGRNLLLLLDLPTPPSTNGLFSTVGRKRVKNREYQSWLRTAGLEIVAQQQRPNAIKGRVAVDVQCVDGRVDLDNRMKPLLDLLVLHGLIEGDDPEIVRDVRVRMVEPTVCTVRPLPGRCLVTVTGVS